MRHSHSRKNAPYNHQRHTAPKSGTSGFVTSLNIAATAPREAGAISRTSASSRSAELSTSRAGCRSLDRTTGAVSSFPQSDGGRALRDAGALCAPAAQPRWSDICKWQSGDICIWWTHIADLLRDKTRKPGLPPLPVALVDRVVALTLTEPSGEATALDRPGDSRSYRCVAALGAVDLEGAPAAASVRLFKLSQDPAFPAKVR